MVHTMYI